MTQIFLDNMIYFWRESDELAYVRNQVTEVKELLVDKIQFKIGEINELKDEFDQDQSQLDLLSRISNRCNKIQKYQNHLSIIQIVWPKLIQRTEGAITADARDAMEIVAQVIAAYDLKPKLRMYRNNDN